MNAAKARDSFVDFIQAVKPNEVEFEPHVRLMVEDLERAILEGRPVRLRIVVPRSAR